MKYAVIVQVRDEQAGKPRRFRYSVKFMCQMLEVSRPGFYSWLTRKESEHARRDSYLTRLIVKIDDDHKGRYGIDRIHRELARQGERVSPKRVRRFWAGRDLHFVIVSAALPRTFDHGGPFGRLAPSPPVRAGTFQPGSTDLIRE